MLLLVWRLFSLIERFGEYLPDHLEIVMYLPLEGLVGLQEKWRLI